jgi:uncharacterized protein YdhG (YjbR/CyaY superfamily)
MSNMKTYKNINEYVKDVPKERKAVLEEMRELVKKLVPKGEEAIRYGMPTIRLNDANFVHFAVMKKHFGFYPTPSGVKAFEEDLKKAGVSYAKGCIRFSYDKPLPKTLIAKIIKSRLKEEQGK